MSKFTSHHALLVLLTMTSGCVDAISFLSLGQVFTAAMTGNTVLFGLAIAHTNGLSIPGYAVSLLGFIVGAAIGAMILGKSSKTPGWGPAVTVCLGVELAVLLLFAITTSFSHTTAPAGSITVDVLIAILAIAMGLQGVTARRVGVNGVTTTVITSTLTGLVETLIWKLGTSVQSGAHGGRVAENPVSSPSILSIYMWISVIIAYGVGAAMCGALIVRWHFAAIWLPIAFVFVVVTTATASAMRVATDRKTQIGI